MRRLRVYLTVIVLLGISAAIGWVLSDAPRYCVRIGWCAASPAPR